MNRRLLLPVLAALALLGGSETAAATTCPIKHSPQCFTVGVPLDRSGVFPGTIALPVVRFQAATQPARGTLVVLAGGPGQAALPFAEDFYDLFKGLVANYDLVVFDERGTGGAGALRCQALDSGDGDPAACAAQIGPTRSLYTTREAVADLEAVRLHLGVPRLSIFGVSYGTRVARAYAAAYPTQTDHLVLDSAVPLNGPDPLLRSTLGALPRVVNDICAKHACRGVTNAPYGNLRDLVSKLDRSRLKGFAVDSRGLRHRDAIASVDVLDLLSASDTDPFLRAMVPAAIRAALAGDAAPMLRLLVGSGGTASDPPEQDSAALFAATTCEENVFPWSRTTPSATREAAGRAALAAIAPQLAPFTAATVYAESFMSLCVPWPVAPLAPVIAVGPLTGVPTLILSGQEDLRTPLEDQATLASSIADARIVQVANTGHSVLSTAPDGCPVDDVVKFFGGLSVSDCLASKPLADVSPVPPRSLARTLRIGGIAGNRGRVAGAVALTVADGIEQALSGLLGANVTRTPSLRGGYYRFGSRGIELHNATFVPGVTVTGLLKTPKHGRLTGTLTVRAGGLSGRLALGGHRLTGTLGHRHVRTRRSARIASAGTRDRLDTLVAALERFGRRPWPILR